MLHPTSGQYISGIRVEGDLDTSYQEYTLENGDVVVRPAAPVSAWRWMAWCMRAQAT